jgi:hypothetical protein
MARETNFANGSRKGLLSWYGLRYPHTKPAKVKGLWAGYLEWLECGQQ